MSDAFEVVEIYQRKRLVVLVAKTENITILRYARWWERIQYRWNKLWEGRREQQAATEAAQALRKIAERV